MSRTGRKRKWKSERKIRGKGENSSMKILKQMISLIMVLCMLCGTMVHAETDTSGGDELLYERMYEAYRAGNQMEDWVVKARKEIAKELGLSAYLDEKYFLSIDYINENQIGRDGTPLETKLDLLIEIGTDEDLEVMEIRSKVQTLAYATYYDGQRISAIQKPRLSGAGNGYFDVGSSVSWGFCAQNSKNFWSNNTAKTGSLVVWDNATVRKVLYYSPGSEGYTGSNPAYDMDSTTFAIGYLNGDSNNNTRAVARINEVQNLQDPIIWGYQAFYMYNDDITCQDIAFLAASVGSLDIIKYSSNSSLTNGNSNYSLAGAVYGIYAQDGDYSSPEYTVTLTEYSDGWGPTGLSSGIKYGWATISVPAGNYWVKEITAPSGFALDPNWYPSYNTAITVNSGSTSYVKVYDSPYTGSLEIYKSSANPEVTNGNACYSLAGAVYGVYLLDGDYSSPEYKITTDQNGYGKVSNIPIGNYWVKEITAPKGFALDENWYPSYNNAAYVGAGTTSTIRVKDYPQMDPVSVLLGKVNKETNSNKPVNSLTLQGAWYEFKFYGVLLNDSTTDPKNEGYEPLKTWVFETDEDGFTYYDEIFKVSGPDLYKSANGDYHLPIGTLTIQEIKAPEGYLVNETVYVRQISTEGNDELVETYNYPITPEATFDLDVIKLQEGTEVGIPGAIFEHTKPDGTTEVLTTDENGCLSFKALNYGDHELREMSAPEGYIKNENVIKYSIATDNSVIFTSENDETVSLSVSEEGNVQAIYYEKIYPFSFVIHKQNDKGDYLADAEFTLYADAECTQVVKTGITSAEGTFKFENLTAFTTYYLKETKSPPGYMMSVDEEGNPIVTEIYVSIIPARNEFKLYVNGAEYDFTSQGDFSFFGTKEAYELNMTVINEIGYVLPQTGSSTTLILMLAGLFIFLISISHMNTKKIMGEHKKQV